jgi:hypothetical protein
MEWWRGKDIAPIAAWFLGFVVPSLVLVGNMWNVRTFTVDDSFISFRYARNFARGLGLVYNPGERIEGYTNFLWTVLLGLGIKLGFDPEVLAKILGGASAVGVLFVVYRLSGSLRAYRTMPCVATWLLATTIVLSGYAVFGLETALFVFLVVGGIYLFLRETGDLMRGPRARAEAEKPTAFPWSGVVFALAGLTRPEPPIFYVPILMLFLVRDLFGRQNLIRAALVYVPVLSHYAFRLAYYGALIPNTAGAKTGNAEGQIIEGAAYVQNYLAHQGPSIWLALFGLSIGIVLRRRDVLAIATLALAILGYVVLVGGDWMPFFRFMAPFEPLVFVLVDLGVRHAVDRRERATSIAFALFALCIFPIRIGNLREAQRSFVGKEKHFWDMAAGGTADWLIKNGDPGELALGDIGYVGYKTDYPILDLLGLVDPVIAKVPGGYRQKIGPEYRQRFFDVQPKYALIISSNVDCQHPSVPGSQVLFRDPRFRSLYDLQGKVTLDGGFAWCIYRNKNAKPGEATAPH